MKARLHKGSFEESMKTMKEIGNSIDDVITYFSMSMVEDEGVDCFLYQSPDQYSFTQVGVDDRICWQAPTYLVNFEGWGVVGMVSELPIGLKIKEEIDLISELKTHKTLNVIDGGKGFLDNIKDIAKINNEMFLEFCKEERLQQLKDKEQNFREELHEEFSDILDTIRFNFWLKDSPAIEDPQFKLFEFVRKNKIDNNKLKIINLLLGIE